jgi:hypothetical protein
MYGLGRRVAAVGEFFDRQGGRLHIMHRRGRALGTSLLTTGVAGLPLLLAVACGLVLGGVLLVVSKRASRLMTPADPMLGMMKVLVANVSILGVAVLCLAGCYVWAYAVLPWFGISLAAGFLVVASYELVRFGTESTALTPRKR